MDVDIDHLGEFWSNGCGYRPFLEQWMWICAVFGAMDLEERIWAPAKDIRRSLEEWLDIRPELGMSISSS